MVIAVAIWTLSLVTAPMDNVGESVLHLINLPFHEAGHIIFSPFGRFMTILGGIHTFWGPSVGAAIIILLNQYIVSYTEYWPFVLGVMLLVLLFAFPGGVGGALNALARRVRIGIGGR